MLFRRLLNFILGYIRISVEGYFIERFINICISKGVFLSNLERNKSSLLYADIQISDFVKVCKVVKSTKCRVKIISKKGVPFLLKRYRKRKIFGISLGLILLLILGLSNFVWNIEIKSNEEIDKEELVSALKEYGLSVGMPKMKVDTKSIINELRLLRGDIAWVRN